MEFILKKQFGFSGVLVAGVIAAVVVLACVGSAVSAKNYGNATEQRLKAKMEDNENIYASYGQKIAELAQVPTMYKNDLKEVITAAIQGRYGENGSQATFQWLKEQNPQLDSKLYAKVANAIEAGRDEFKNAQTQMLDIKRSYQTELGSVWHGFWLGMVGYPKIDLDQYKIVTTDRASDAFRTKREAGPLQLR